MDAVSSWDRSMPLSLRLVHCLLCFILPERQIPCKTLNDMNVRDGYADDVPAGSSPFSTACGLRPITERKVHSPRKSARIISKSAC
jgi:hypothetical protein